MGKIWSVDCAEGSLAEEKNHVGCCCSVSEKCINSVFQLCSAEFIQLVRC